jgi:thiamine-phosphate pyrophosphorylase
VRLPDPPLLAITDRRQARCPLVETAEALFAGGCRWLSLREKDLPPEERLALLRQLVALGRRFGATVGIHDDIAAAADADALHLPEGGAIGAARERLGPILIGVSAHDAAGLARAAAAGADYATLSPIFVSASKPEYGPALGLAALGDAARTARLPILALGGIDERTIAGAVAAGAAGVAVMGELMRASDAEKTAARLVAALRGALAAR